jgi:hypothetical protein
MASPILLGKPHGVTYLRRVKDYETRDISEVLEEIISVMRFMVLSMIQSLKKSRSLSQ